MSTNRGVLTPASRRQFLRGLFGATVGLSVGSVLAACTPGAPAGIGGLGASQQAPSQSGGNGELKIGLLSGFSGPYAAFGPDMANCADVYLDQHGGMLGGLKVNTIQEDEGSTVQDALTKARKLIEQDQVDVIMGIVSSANALALRNMIDQAQKPTIITNANANAITGDQRSQYIFRTALNAYQNASALVAWTPVNVGKRIFTMAPDYAAGQEWTAAFKQGFEAAGGTIIDSLLPPLGNADYAPFISKVKPENPDGVWAQFAGADQLKFTQQWNDYIGTSIPLIGSGMNWQTAGQLGQAAKVWKTFAVAWELGIDNPTNKQFVDAFFKKFNTYPVYGAYHYDGMALLDKILQSSNGDKSAAAIVKGFAGVSEFDSVRGTIKVDPETHGLTVPQWRAIANDDSGTMGIQILEQLGVFPPQPPSS
ncbi:MAG: ABC transporter substrate-binding protein [Chloroflexi bacterium]|nr:ABC transporter substrate-binding protein [Chloroflexota bacterium]